MDTVYAFNFSVPYNQTALSYMGCENTQCLKYNPGYCSVLKSTAWPSEVLTDQELLRIRYIYNFPASSYLASTKSKSVLSISNMTQVRSSVLIAARVSNFMNFPFILGYVLYLISIINMYNKQGASFI